MGGGGQAWDARNVMFPGIKGFLGISFNENSLIIIVKIVVVTIFIFKDNSNVDDYNDSNCN